VNGRQEIWLSGYQEEAIWLIFKPATQEWEAIPRRIGNTILYSGDLFLANDGTIWSRTQWYNEPTNIETVSVLSIFNEETRRFETADVPVEISVTQETRYYFAQPVSTWSVIILDAKGVFWIFVSFVGIYRYDPATQTAEQVLDLPNTPINEAAIGPDGSFYLSKPNESISTNRSLASLTQGMLLHFKPSTGQIETIKTPNEEWPTFLGMRVDQHGQLWLGAIGYRDVNEHWHLIHPNPEEFFDHAGDHTWVTPELILESSDGRLWYRRYMDGSGEGVAWYDPELKTGCLIWGTSSTVIEDSKQQLWMIAYGKLYSYSLKSYNHAPKKPFKNR
jgi:hypothetical protein